MDIECYFVIGQMLFGAAVVADDDGNRSADEERSAIRPFRDGGEGGFEASPNHVDTLLGRHAWSKRGERIGEAGHEESKPAK
jgi:hypothetical protein